VRYIKFETGTKDRCRHALEMLKHNEAFECLMENLLLVSEKNASSRTVDMNHDDPEVGPMRGVARFLAEFNKICRDPRKHLGGQNKKPKPTPDR